MLPSNRGLRVRTLSQLRLLSTLDNVESITLLALSTVPISDEALRELEQLLPKVHVQRPIVRDTYIRRSRRALIHFLRRRFLHNEPYLIATHCVTEMSSLLAHQLASTQYDVVYFGYLGMMAYLKQVKHGLPRARCVLEQHNLEWQIFHRLTEHLPTPLRQLALLEAFALRFYERQALKLVDSVVAISDADATQFRKLANVEAIVVSPFIEPNARSTTEHSGPDIGYIGHLGWQPNTIGLDWFCQKVWPLVRAKVPHARLTIAGPGLSKRHDGSIESPPLWIAPGITIVGYVESLEDFYRDHLVMVAPVIGGSGVRMKILETLSAGMPTVTTTDGAAGLTLKSGRDVLIADDPVSFADHTVRLLANQEQRNQLRQAGFDYLKEHHSMEVTLASLARAVIG